MKNPAFTLAEVLITLAIIGVVAAITIPSIIANNQKQEFVVGLQKSYNTINNAMALSQAENGELTSWPWETLSTVAVSENFMKTYFLPYLKVQKNCGYSNDKDCFAQSHNFLNGNVDGNYNLNLAIYKMVLADGMSVLVRFISLTCVSSPSVCGYIRFDVNGKKGPNVMGRDTFDYYIYPHTNQILLAGTVVGPYDENSGTWKPNNVTCNPAVDSGTFCGARIQQDGWKMNY